MVWPPKFMCLCYVINLILLKITHFLCYFSSPKYASVLLFYLFPCLLVSILELKWSPHSSCSVFHLIECYNVWILITKKDLTKCGKLQTIGCIKVCLYFAKLKLWKHLSWVKYHILQTDSQPCPTRSAKFFTK